MPSQRLRLRLTVRIAACSGREGMASPNRENPTDAVFQANSPWSLYCWFQLQDLQPVSTLLAGVGNPLEEYSRYFGIRDGKLIFWMGEDNGLAATAASVRRGMAFCGGYFRRRSRASLQRRAGSGKR